MSIEVTYKNCPDCNHRYPSYAGYKDWCDACGWNIAPDKQNRTETGYAPIYNTIVEKFSKQYSTSLFHTVCSATDIRPRRTIFSFLSSLVGVSALVLWISMIALSVWLLLMYPNLFAIAGALLCGLIAWYLRPEVAPMPKRTLQRTTVPTLFNVIEGICTELNAPMPDYVVLSTEFNASMGYAGIKRKRVLTLGYPLLLTLSAAECVALIAHEIAHDVNGDPARGFWQHFGTVMFEKWFVLTYPFEIMSSDDVGLYTKLISIPFNLLSWCVSQLFLGCSYMLSWLMWRESQRCEYYADLLAYTVAGNKNALSMFDKLAYYPYFAAAQQAAVLAPKGGKGMFERYADMIRELPSREIERIHRVNMLDSARIDSSHPPTPYRIAFIESRGILSGRYSLTDHKFQTLLNELRNYQPEVEELLIDEYRAAIHW
ncbi:MAG: M48 family metallopeptidase [Candidatus Kapabacteria bacterium]|nr:M48 family metallopeptidase [Candidatus Kapabacteria bacterium]